MPSDATEQAESPPTTLLCPACGYDLRGIEASERCPECGTRIDRSAAGASRIPWVRRKQISAWPAYWRTVLLVMFHPARVGAEIAQPVSFDDARRFARRTALLAWTPVALFFLWLWLASMRLPLYPVPPIGSQGEWRWTGGVGRRLPQVTVVQNVLTYEVGDVLSLGFALEVLVAAVLFASLLLWLTFLCRAGSYFFHPSDRPVVRQNRAVALSYYACAPLALMPLVVPFVWYAYWSTNVTRTFGPTAAMTHPAVAVVGWMLPLLPLTWCLACNLALLRRTTGCGAGRVFIMAMALPVMWAVLTVVAAALPPAALLLALMLLSVIG